MHHAEHLEEPADPRLRREDEAVARRGPSKDAKRRNRQEHVPERPGMDRERQGRSSASAASWRRRFVASAELE